MREVKLITADDMLVERVVVTNASEEPADLAAYLFGRGTPLRERFRPGRVVGLKRVREGLHAATAAQAAPAVGAAPVAAAT